MKELQKNFIKIFLSDICRFLSVSATGIICATVFTIGFMTVFVFASDMPSGPASENTSNKIQITADSMNAEGGGGFAEFIGNVKAVQGAFVISSDNLKIYYESRKDGTKKPVADEESIKKIVATGNVKISSDDKVALTDYAEYTTDTMILVLTGEGSKIISGNNSISGSKITLFRSDGRVKVESAGEKRVKALFYPTEKIDAGNMRVSKAPVKKDITAPAIEVPETPAEKIVKVIETPAEKIVEVIETPVGDLKYVVGITIFENKTSFGDLNVGGLFYKDIVEAVTGSCSDNIVLAEPDEDRYSDCLVKLPRQITGEIDNFVLAESGRKAGINAIITGTLTDITAIKEEQGILWLKDRQAVVRVRILAEVYDTDTGAKFLDECFSYNKEIDEEEFESISADKKIDSSLLEDALKDISVSMGKKICGIVNKQDWKGYIVSVNENNIEISSGEKAGLMPGNILDVYSANRLEGFNGQKFFLPGNKTGKIKITDVNTYSSKAILVSGDGIEPDSSVKPRQDL